LLLPRDGDSRDKVSNLLNIADGFLGDYLRLHVILTTNVPITQFDPAILRPGRLIGIREFRRLNQEDALRLAQVKRLVVPDQPDFSLAELYCSRADADRFGQALRIGFA
jgi:ATP-dependent 26S proteasome regulatory subunit